jgi:hypothetical protein
MAGETVITVVGNTTADAELRFTPSGSAVANFTVASTPRMMDRQSGEWKDGEPLFLRCNAWRDLAEHVAETVTKGMRVIVVGRLKPCATPRPRSPRWRGPPATAPGRPAVRRLAARPAISILSRRSDGHVDERHRVQAAG